MYAEVQTIHIEQNYKVEIKEHEMPNLIHCTKYSSLLIPLSTFSRKPAYDAVGVTFPESDSGKQLEIIWTIKWIRILVVSEHN